MFSSFLSCGSKCQCLRCQQLNKKIPPGHHSAGPVVFSRRGGAILSHYSYERASGVERFKLSLSLG